MLAILGTLGGAIIKGLGGWAERRERVKEAKLKAKVARYEAEAQRAMRMVEISSEWDLEAMRQSRYSLKDEIILIIWFAPLVLWWVDHEKAREWIAFVDGVPTWYQVGMFGIMAASFGLRWWFTKKG